LRYGQFEWDESKNNINLIKHGITFQEASTVFEDFRAVIVDDYRHSKSEERFVIIGKSKKERLLMVCHCYRDSRVGEIIRIISARKAGKSEYDIYGGDI